MHPYLPKRNDIIFIDFEPVKGKEIGKVRPALVLSSEEYNKKTGLVIICPISTSIRGGETEVPINNLEKPSVVTASLIQTLSWRKSKFAAVAEPAVIDEVLARLIPLIGAAHLFSHLDSFPVKYA
ncbi:putative MazF protein [Xenorhabdus nematophila ATCC 19061]|uniref:MazF protein n=2 Tax=Xenorhabdus nematophila TaxID=628 RepID=D3VF23_XENNA|nr:putative MazF protein [Xenorhabdus nematophila ATCC 19061]